MTIKHLSLCTIAVLILCINAAGAVKDLEFFCNTKEEKEFILDSKDSALLGSVSRYAEKGKRWKYKFPISPGADCVVSVKIQGKGVVSLSSGSQTSSEVISSPKELSIVTIDLTAPIEQYSLILTIKSADFIRLQHVKLSYTDRDSDMNGISDIVENMLGVSKSSPLQLIKRPKEPYTSFQTPTSYKRENDIKTDSVIIYNSNKESYDSWKAKGYDTQTMYGFRVGDDYIKKYPEEGQTAADGRILTCGPGSYYMVPAKNRIDAALAYFKKAIQSGSTAVIPEEPEYFQQAGYSGAFKKEWKDYYKEDWQDPASSIEARWKSEQLKGYLQYRMVKSILDQSLKQKPSVKRMVAAHSQISYYSSGIIYPHFQVLKDPSFQELIGQVWTGTARAGNRYQGDFAERTFEWGYLEYSSLYNLMRGTGKQLWFLMDPLEDNPDRTMEDYQENYEKTLLGSLMFPAIDKFEVMPWPTRIYGRVPDWFATKIGTIVNMLNDIHNQTTHEYYMGTQGIATFVADSMAWQRGIPYPSDFSGFHGITLPLLMKGIPIQVAQLERSVEPGYLDEYKVLFLTYDLLKPMSPDYNTALANWVKKGGTLVIFGGNDPYNNLQEWWKSAGYATPQEHLFAQLGVNITKSVSLDTKTEFKPLISEENPYRNLENQKVYTLDLSDRILDDGSIYLKFEDAHKTDGWGSLVSSVELIVDGKAQVFKAGSDKEKNLIVDNNGSKFNGLSRFADANCYWIYKFNVPKNSKVTANISMGNQFMLSTAVTPINISYHAVSVGNNKLSQLLPSMDIHISNNITAYETDADPLYSINETDLLPFFEKAVDKGNVMFFGVDPSYFSSSIASANALRSIAQYACEKAGLEYKETEYLGIRRGKYVAMRTYDTPYPFIGTYINILDPEISMIMDPIIEPNSRGVMVNVTDLMADRTPRVLISSDRIEAKVESDKMTSMLAGGPYNTKGVTRISTANMDVSSVKVLDTTGKNVPFTQRVEYGTLFIKYNSLPEGVVIRVEWE